MGKAKATALVALTLALSRSAGEGKSTAATPASAPTKLEVERAYQASKSAVVSANLLLTSGQARLKRVQFAFNQAGETALRERAKAAFQSYSASLSRFRLAADGVDAGRPELREAQAKASARAGAPSPDASTTELLGEIASLRSSYDAADARRRAEEVRALFRRWGAAASPKLGAPQDAVLAEGQALAAQTLAAAAALAPKKKLASPAPAKAIAAELGALKEDAAALTVELELLDFRYRLDNLIAARPELASP